ncbi:glycoside hydrolase family 73 protein [Bacillus sp. 1P06AnD]|uniref:glycoside hydrolase family 73 protein n=1 Tax=Bacillus sp. 1P06AnD TaxID=3132208 RepID=UPI0039A0717C
MKKRRWFFLFVAAVMLFFVYRWFQQDTFIFTDGDHRKKMIQFVDDESIGKIQVNWEDVAAVYAVQHKGELESMTEQNIKQLTSLFIAKEEGTYKLRTIEQVGQLLNFNGRQVEELKGYKQQFGEKRVPAGKENNYQFIDQIKGAAIQNFKEYGVLPSITISQAILESNWGNSSLSKDYNNLFGIKGHTKWSGKTASLKTTEHFNQQTSARFRVYSTMDESIKDHGDFLKRNPRYAKNGLFSAKTYMEQAKVLEKAGYSTAENEKGERIYSQLLTQLIRQYNLQVIDSEAYKEKG